jgi:hypothetical protein
VGLELGHQALLVDQRTTRDPGFDKLPVQKPEELLDHEIAVALRMHQPLLRILSRQADIFVQVETPAPAGVELPRIGSLCQVLVETGWGTPCGQSEDTFFFLLECPTDLLFHDLRSDFTHLFKVSGHQHLDRHS